MTDLNIQCRTDQQNDLHTGRPTLLHTGRQGLAKTGGPQTVIKTRKGMHAFVDIFNRQINIVNSKLKEIDRLSDDLCWLLLTVVEHTCLSGHTLSGTVYPQQPTYRVTPSCH